jgi:DNA-binding transcriptional LysR family regulator
VQRLPTLLAGHPGLKVQLVISNRFGDMIENRLDLALRVGEITDSSLVMRRSWTADRIVVAAPSYVERHGAPSVPADLERHTCIVHDVGADSDLWTFVMPEGPEHPSAWWISRQRRSRGTASCRNRLRHRSSAFA